MPSPIPPPILRTWVKCFLKSTSFLSVSNPSTASLFAPRRYAVVGFASLLLGCGGGGGGGVSSTPVILAPPTPVLESAAAEIANTPGLSLVKATQIYDEDGHGGNSQIGVLDSGVDAGHEELAGRVIGGGDWQDASQDGRVDPFGHGTHVASIIAAAKDKKGIYGIAPEAEIVSYRILNSSGVFGGKSGNDMIPAILGDVATRNLKVVNNSWASYYEINDFAPEVIENSITEELNAYRDTSTADGPMMVWAAGNSSDNQVSIRSGLPHHFPELEANWLAVVAVDAEGHEPRYTNRCGLAADWCLTAPGGGNTRSINGINAAKSGGGYTRKSGTSMAAPVVSGALALIMESMPTLSPRQAAVRLKTTATLEGLTSSDGCTIDSCSESTMKNIFGHGLIQVDAALEPIGDASFLTEGGQSTDTITTYLKPPHMMGDSVKVALDGAAAAVHDDFDGAVFLTPIAARVIAPTVVAPSLPSSNRKDSFRYGTIDMPMGFVTSFSPSAPNLDDVSAELVDIPTAPVEGWHGFNIDGPLRTRVMVGHGHQRQAVHFIMSQGDDQNHAWIGGGIDQTRDMLNGVSSGGFDVNGAASQWVFLGKSAHIGNTELSAEALYGQTLLSPSSSSLIREGQFTYDAWTVKAGHQWQGVDWSIKWHQPPALRSGQLTLDQPVSFTADGVNFAPKTYQLNLDQRELHRRLAAKTTLWPKMELTAEFADIENLGHLAGEDHQQLSFSLIQKF